MVLIFCYVYQASSAEDVPGGQKAGSDITESDDAGKDEQYEEAFSKMKKAAGESFFSFLLKSLDKKIMVYMSNSKIKPNS